MSDRPTVGHITGELFLQIAGGEKVEIGKVKLPLISTRVSPPGAGHMSFGVGVDLQAVAEEVRAIFRSHERGSDD